MGESEWEKFCEKERKEMKIGQIKLGTKRLYFWSGCDEWNGMEKQQVQMHDRVKKRLDDSEMDEIQITSVGNANSRLESIHSTSESLKRILCVKCGKCQHDVCAVSLYNNTM